MVFIDIYVMRNSAISICLLLIMSSASFGASLLLNDAQPAGAGKLEVSSYQQTNSPYSYGTLISKSNYFFPSTGPGVSIRYGINERSDLIIQYTNDTKNMFLLPGAFDFSTPVYLDSARQLSGGTSLIALKRSFLSVKDGSWLDASFYAGYEFSAYVLEYETTVYLMPPVTSKDTLNYTRSASSFGLTVSRQFGMFSPYISGAFRSLTLYENDRTDRVNGSGNYIGYGLITDIYGIFNLFIEGGTETQQWGRGWDKFYGTAIEYEPCMISVIAYGVGMKF